MKMKSSDVNPATVRFLTDQQLKVIMDEMSNAEKVTSQLAEGIVLKLFVAMELIRRGKGISSESTGVIQNDLVKLITSMLPFNLSIRLSIWQKFRLLFA